MNIIRIRQPDRTWYEIILWWEIRRIPYNIILYFIGLGSFYISYVTIPLVYIVIGFGLNLFYTFGWISELMAQRKLDAAGKMKFARRSFIAYLVISTAVVFGIALLPVILF